MNSRTTVALDNRENLQQRLNAFYDATLKESLPALAAASNELSFPFLVSVSNAYLTSPVRIMFVGKETNGWIGKLKDFDGSPASIETILRRYDDQMQRGKWEGRFFQTLARVANELTNGNPGAIVWNNLIKMDWDQGRSDSRSSIAHSQELFDLSSRMLRYEIEVLKPDVIIFASGPNYDRVIKANFAYDTLSVEARALWKFRVGEIMCFRTRHPNAIRTAGFRPTGDYYAEIVRNIRNQFAGRYAA